MLQAYAGQISHDCWTKTTFMLKTHIKRNPENTPVTNYSGQEFQKQNFFVLNNNTPVTLKQGVKHGIKL